MALYEYLKKVPSALPNPNDSLFGRLPSEAISSANRELSELVHQNTVKNSKQQEAFLPPSRVNRFPLWFHVVYDVETLNYEGVSAMPPVPAPTSSYSFRENTFREIEFFDWFAKYIASEI